MELRQIARNICPDIVLRSYRDIRNQFSPASLSAPVVQIYINDGDIYSTAGFNNFLSFLSASERSSGRLYITLRDESGKIILEQSDHLGHFENRFISIQSMLREHGLQSRLGLISLRFIPARLRKSAYKKLGTLTSHFFMFYRNKQGAVAMIHPSSTLDVHSPPAGPFITNQMIDTTGLEAVKLYQCNPSSLSHELTIGLQDAETKQIICSESLNLLPFSTHEISFEARKAYKNDGRVLRVFTSSLPTMNSKPMLCRCYSDGRFSISHS